MKSFLFILVLLSFAVLALAQTTLTWNGSYTTDWEDPTNWTPNAIPNSTTNVIIASNEFGRYPVIDYTSGTCLNLSLNDGKPLTLNATASLTVLGWAELGGNLMLSGSGGVTITGDLSCAYVVSITGTGQLTVLGNATWYSGSSLVDTSATVINLYKDLSILAGADFTMTNGGSVVFKGSETSNIINYSADTQFGNLTAGKNVGGSVNIHLDSTQPFTINNYLSNNAGNKFYCNDSMTVIMKGNAVQDFNPGDIAGTYGFKWEAGVLKMDGGYQYLSLAGPGNRLNNLICSATTGVITEYPLVLKNNLTIESGYLSVDTYNTITLSGNWDNQVGPAGFIEGEGRVIFNNSVTHQTILSSETFNILEVNMAAALRFTAGKTVTCAVYDWTAGGIDMNTGATFTALDLADPGIYGGWWLTTSSAGVINLTNENVDIKGNLNISNGTFNVYSTAAYSTWNSYDNASLVMSGGTLDFHGTGISIYNVLGSPDPTYFTLTFSGGTIRTEGNFECTWAGFAPSGGTVLFYGNSGSLIDMPLGSFYNLTINKSAAAATLWGNNFALGNRLYLQSGTLDATGIQISCRYANIAGTLIMSTKLAASESITWHMYSQVSAANNSIIECGGNWTADILSNVQLNSTIGVYFTSTTAQFISVYSSTHSIGQLNIGEDSSGGFYSGGVYTVDSTQPLNVPGWLYIRAGNTLTLNDDTGMTVADDLRLWGTLQVGSGTVTVNDQGIIYGGTLQIDSGSLTINGVFYFQPTGVINIDSGTLALPHYFLGIPTSAVVTLESGTIICVSLDVYGTFQPAGGTVVLSSDISHTHSIYLAPGNWLPNLTIDSNRTYHLTSDIIIKGNFTLDFGTLDVQHISNTSVYNIYIAGNWINNQGPANFNERTGRVVFNGTDFQTISTTETFNILEVNKVPSGGGGDALRIESGYEGLNILVTCNQYDWTAGALDVNLRATFTALDLADNGLYGDYTCNAGCVLNLTNDAYVDLFGELHIFGGEVNIFSNSATRLYSYWPASASAWIEISGGSLNFRNKGIWLQNGYALTDNISGGIISMTGNFVGRRDNFNPIGGTFALYGDANSTIDFDVSTSSFYDLLIDKSTASAQVELTSGAAIPLICRRNLSINRGNFYMNRETLHCYGDLNINDGGKMSFASFNDVKLAANKSLNVNSGGMIDVYGSTADQTTKFSHISDGNFHFNVNSGGHLAANYVLFEYLNSSGVYIKPGAFVDGLHNCTFQNGVAGGVLFRVDNSQNIIVTYANFPTNAGSGAHNVWKSVDAGQVYFSNYTGAFSGSTFEDDFYHRVFWTGSSIDLYVSAYSIDRPDDYVCAPLSFSVTVTNGGSNDIATPFRVDLYKNLASAPPAASLGDYFLEIPSLEAGQSKIVTFTNLSTDLVETWNSYLRLDTTGFVTETNEANNLSGPYTTTWYALPEIADLNIVQTGPSALQISWSYPVSVARYNVYRSTDPYFTPGPENLFAQPLTPSLTTAGYEPMNFYRVRAVRDMP